MADITVKAPGRICLFGDHQDYLELPIIACAINQYITINGVANGKDYFNITTPDLGECYALRFRESITTPTKGNFLEAALKVVASYGCHPDQGYDITITGTIPINAGLSSSSAVVVAWVQWLLATFGCNQEINPRLVAEIAYQAEVVEQNSPGGKMDQYTSALGNIIYLETDTASRNKNLGNTLSGLIIGVSGIPKDTIGILGDLKGNTLLAISKIKNKHPNFNLSKATLTDYEKYKSELPIELVPFFYAAIKNHLITQEALLCFGKKYLEYKKIGHLMTEHHTVLKESLHLTVPRIDAMIDAALAAGAYGAKIVGSGGGGSICALSPKGKEEKIITAIINAGAMNAYQVKVAKGVHIV